MEQFTDRNVIFPGRVRKLLTEMWQRVIISVTILLILNINEQNQSFNSHLFFENTGLLFTANKVLDKPEDLQHEQTRISKTPEKKGNKRVASPRPRSTPPPGWRGCPGPLAAAYSAAPSTEIESCPTDCSEPTWTVTDTLPLRTWLNTHTHTHTHHQLCVIYLMLNTKPGSFCFFLPVAKLRECKRWSVVNLEYSLW